MWFRERSVKDKNAAGSSSPDIALHRIRRGTNTIDELYGHCNNDNIHRRFAILNLNLRPPSVVIDVHWPNCNHYSQTRPIRTHSGSACVGRSHRFLRRGRVSLVQRLAS
ncbi:hypothetical protein EMCRGX_G004688 [Ephydatia muelleri]